MKLNWLSVFLVGGFIVGAFVVGRGNNLMPEAVAAEAAVPAPEFTHAQAAEWLNSPPLQLAGLRGKVVLLDVWTFGCWNCYRSFPWLKTLETRYVPQGLQVIGVHSPEFEHEHERARLAEKIKEFGLTNPQMMDNDFSYWNALGNRYWPAFYLIDKQGRIRGRYFGETHPGDRNAKAIEAQVQTLLKETS